MAWIFLLLYCHCVTSLLLRTLLCGGALGAQMKFFVTNHLEISQSVGNNTTMLRKINKAKTLFLPALSQLQIFML